MSNAISLNAYSYNNFTSGIGGKLYVPVKPSSVVYAQFDHISGFPAKSNQNGVSVSKIQILNSLINQLVTMKNTPKVQPDVNMSNDQMDAMIKNYQEQIQTSMQMSQATGYGLAGVAPQSGALFSVNV
ncbi:MAG: hypothetical protein IJP62_06110 [Treponema sp.]|nr:hypothetical protein [Treponema sp.]